MRFEKVSRSQYDKDCREDTYYTGISEYKLAIQSPMHPLSSRFPCIDDMTSIYDELPLPKRATKKSAGYDIYAPYSFRLDPGETIKIATGIRVILDDDKFLMCAPRSGHGFKARIQLDNTLGIIDADYADSKNEGHILLKLTNDSHTGKSIEVKKGEGMAQAIILSYFTVEDDISDRLRDGGFGSTNI